eukprot:3200699-Amphidinium_carterae.1
MRKTQNCTDVVAQKSLCVDLRSHDPSEALCPQQLKSLRTSLASKGEACTSTRTCTAESACFCCVFNGTPQRNASQEEDGRAAPMLYL